MVKDHVRSEHQTRGFAGRFGAGTPRINDGSFLFLQHMISKMKRPDEGGARLAIVFNGSPLFTGAAGSGESEIRRWIIENDWLEAVVALPDQLFYNTGISTYFWVVTNRKSTKRQGKIQLIDARESWTKMRKSLGNKRKMISEDQIAEITRLYNAFEEGPRSKIFPNESFGFLRIAVYDPAAPINKGKRKTTPKPDYENVPLPARRVTYEADTSRRLRTPRIPRSNRHIPRYRSPTLCSRCLARSEEDQDRLRDPPHPSLLHLHPTPRSICNRPRDQNPRSRDSGATGRGNRLNWPMVQVRHIARLEYGSSLPVGDRIEGDIAVFGSNGPVGLHISCNTGSPVIVVGRKGSHGKLQYSSSPVFAIDTTYFIDSECTQTHLRWLYYTLSTLDLDRAGQDVGVPGLSREYAYSQRIPLPSSTEQRAIADYLDTETGRIDALISRNAA